jgi:hypothetical protein
MVFTVDETVHMLAGQNMLLGNSDGTSEDFCFLDHKLNNYVVSLKVLQHLQLVTKVYGLHMCFLSDI